MGSRITAENAMQNVPSADNPPLTVQHAAKEPNWLTDKPETVSVPQVILVLLLTVLRIRPVILLAIPAMELQITTV